MTIDSGYTRTSDDYAPVVVFTPRAERTASVLKGREMSVTLACDGLAAGQMVWVAPADAEAVRTWLKEYKQVL